jgi:hypothetical protein
MHISGNRRFRFIIALNLDRYRYAVDRRAKSKVVNSIVTHVHHLGGRFLEKNDGTKESWFPVSSEVARRKVSHALRDKFPFNPIQKSFNSLKARINDCAYKCGVAEERLFDEINLRILQAFLPNMDHASDAYVENLLAAEVDEVLTTHLKVMEFTLPDEPILMTAQNIPEVEPSLITYHQTSCNGDERFLDLQFISDYFVRDSKREYESKIIDRYCKAEEFPTTCKHRISSNERGMYFNFLRLEELDFIDNSLNEMSVDSQMEIHPLDMVDDEFDSLSVDSLGDIHPAFDMVGDLPQGFTAHDCEILLDSLDHLSSMIE